MGKKLDGIILLCYAGDVHLARSCVASIRYWMPDIPLWLHKDVKTADFYTKDIEEAWDVQLMDSSKTSMGSLLTKIALFASDLKGRYLIIDSDIVFLGDLVAYLEQFDADIHVSTPADKPSAGFMAEHYFDFESVKHYSPKMHHPAFGFNTGHIVLDRNVLNKKDFRPIVSWISGHPIVADKSFMLGDQGIMNFIVHRAYQNGTIKLCYEMYHYWAKHQEADVYPIENIKKQKGIPKLIHWAGTIDKDNNCNTPRFDIIEFFQEYYHQNTPESLLKPVGEKYPSSIAPLSKIQELFLIYGSLYAHKSYALKKGLRERVFR